ncbi:TPA: hypothetical protein I8V98_002662 [Corynebacterium striatum]|nr:hypothetical protein [Corynebacterium striatum]HAT1392826.1 hypothetical protein [Corynebacterium striatum]
MTINENDIIQIPGDGPSIPEGILNQLIVERLAKDEAEATAQRRANAEKAIKAEYAAAQKAADAAHAERVAKISELYTKYAKAYDAALPFKAALDEAIKAYNQAQSAAATAYMELYEVTRQVPQARRIDLDPDSKEKVTGAGLSGIPIVDGKEIYMPLKPYKLNIK